MQPELRLHDPPPHPRVAALNLCGWQRERGIERARQSGREREPERERERESQGERERERARGREREREKEKEKARAPARIRERERVAHASRRACGSPAGGRVAVLTSPEKRSQPPACMHKGLRCSQLPSNP